MLKITIISSDEDSASKSIRSQLLEKYAFVEQKDKGQWTSEYFSKIYTFNPEESPNLTFTLVVTDLRMVFIDKKITSKDIHGDFVIFASRHRSKTGKPALLCHTPGNWGDDNQFGGKRKSISNSSGILHHYIFSYLKKYATKKRVPFAIDQEVTHHGPSELKQPVTFIELGSDEKGWKNLNAAEVVADTIISSGKKIARFHYKNNKIIKGPIKVCTGFGGTHYMTNLSKLIKYNCGFAHTVPKYHIKKMNQLMIQKIIGRTSEEIDYWVLDWKGLDSNQRDRLIKILESCGIEYVRRKHLQKKLKDKNQSQNPNQKK